MEEMRSRYDFSRGERGKHFKQWDVVRDHILAMLEEDGLAAPCCQECRRPMELVIAIVIRPPRPPEEVKPVPAWHCRHCWGKG